jgi:hypothetical protein
VDREAIVLKVGRLLELGAAHEAGLGEVHGGDVGSQ